MEHAPPASREETGVIGVDINADHLALVETDRYGNPVSKQSIPFNLYGKSSDQAKAVIGDAAAKAVAYAANAHKSLVIEELDFQKKKRNRNRHVWSIWRDLSKKLKTALAAHFRAAKSRSRSSCKSAPETGISPEVVGENPSRESSEALLA